MWAHGSTAAGQAPPARDAARSAVREAAKGSKELGLFLCAAILKRATHPPSFVAEVAQVLHEGGLLLVIVIAAGANVRRKGTLSGALFRMARRAPGRSAHTRTSSRDEVVALLNAGGCAVIEEALLPGARALLAR